MQSPGRCVGCGAVAAEMNLTRRLHRLAGAVIGRCSVQRFATRVHDGLDGLARAPSLQRGGGDDLAAVQRGAVLNVRRLLVADLAVADVSLEARHRGVGRVGDLLLRADLSLGVIGLLREALS